MGHDDRIVSGGSNCTGDFYFHKDTADWLSEEKTSTLSDYTAIELDVH